MGAGAERTRAMKAQRIDEYHKHGCHFYGKLVVVEYYEEMKSDPHKFGAELAIDYYADAKKLVAESGYKVVRELLGIPAYVCEVE